MFMCRSYCKPDAKAMKRERDFDFNQCLVTWRDGSNKQPILERPTPTTNPRATLEVGGPNDPTRRGEFYNRIPLAFDKALG
jgi:hypothetical protein